MLYYLAFTLVLFGLVCGEEKPAETSQSDAKPQEKPSGNKNEDSKAPSVKPRSGGGNSELNVQTQIQNLQNHEMLQSHQANEMSSNFNERRVLSPTLNSLGGNIQQQDFQQKENGQIEANFNPANTFVQHNQPNNDMKFMTEMPHFQPRLKNVASSRFSPPQPLLQSSQPVNDMTPSSNMGFNRFTPDRNARNGNFLPAENINLKEGALRDGCNVSGRYLKAGDRWTESGICGIFFCAENNYRILNTPCPELRFQEGADCRASQQDLDLDYPRCCPTLICPSVNKNYVMKEKTPSYSGYKSSYY